MLHVRVPPAAGIPVRLSTDSNAGALEVYTGSA